MLKSFSFRWKNFFAGNIHFMKIWIYTPESILSFISYSRFSFIYIIFFELISLSHFVYKQFV